jgi:hypothetical protein
MRYEITRWADEALWPFGPPPKGRYPSQNATFARGDEAPYYEIVEVDLTHLLAGAS